FGRGARALGLAADRINFRALFFATTTLSGAGTASPLLGRGLWPIAPRLGSQRRRSLFQHELAIDRRVLPDRIEPSAGGRRGQAVVVMLDRFLKVARHQSGVTQGKVDLGAQDGACPLSSLGITLDGFAKTAQGKEGRGGVVTRNRTFRGTVDGRLERG